MDFQEAKPKEHTTIKIFVEAKHINIQIKLIKVKIIFTLNPSRPVFFTPTFRSTKVYKKAPKIPKINFFN